MVLGGLLIVLGVAGFVVTGSQHYTALIPSWFGIAFMLLGGLALNPSARKHAMHAAAALALLAFVFTVSGWIGMIKWASGSTPERPAAVVSKSLMALLTLLFVALCVRSFIHARRSAGALPGDPTS
jgi:hypothetical protein